MQRIKTYLCKTLRFLIRPRYMAIVAVSFLLFGLLRFITLNINALNPIARALGDYSTTDMFYNMMLTSPADTSDVIVIVDITQLHDRDSIATVLEEVDDLEPAAIDVDVVFEYPKEPAGDLHLVSVAATMSNAVFSFKMMDPDRERNEFTRQAHSFFAEELGLNEGFVNVDRSMAHDIPLCLEMHGKAYPSVIARMMEILHGKPFDYQSLRSEPIDYEPTIFRIIPYDSIQQNAQYITGKVVMFGGAYESVDMLYTPLGQMHGIGVLCYAMKTMLEKKHQKNCTGWLYWLLTAVLSYISTYCLMAYCNFFKQEKEEQAATKDKETRNKVKQKLKEVAIDLMSTTFVISVVIFILMLIYIMGGYYLFEKWRISFDLTPTLSAIALALVSAEFVHITLKHLGILKKTNRNKS